MDELKPFSSFLNTLNNSPNNTLPAARYSIFGSEHNFEYLRLAESAIRKNSGSPLEQESLISYHRYISAFYFTATSYYSYLSGKYFWLYSNADSTDPEYFHYYDSAVYFAQVAQQWFRGFVSLVYYQQRDWDQKIIGVSYYEIDGKVYKDANDGLLPASTQAPSFFKKFDGVNRRLRADGTNHLEETVHPSVKDRLEGTFSNTDIDIPETNDGGDGDGGGGTTPGPIGGCGGYDQPPCQ